METKEMRINNLNVKIHFLFLKRELKNLKSYFEIMGFKDESDFNNLLKKLVFFRDFDISRELIDRIIKNINSVFNLCSSVLQDEEINLFFFETKDFFVSNKMGGSTGFCTNKNCILVLLNLETFSDTGLKNTVVHELAHAMSPYYDMSDMSVGQGIVFEGIAENFRESLVDKIKSSFVLEVKEEEVWPLFNKIKFDLNSKNLNDYYEVFFGTGKYPLWAGYAIGYYFVKGYISRIKNFAWKNVLREDPKEILKEVVSTSKF